MNILRPLLLLISTALTMPQVPASARSTAVIRRITPPLQTALASQQVALGAPIYIRIFKLERELELWVDNGRRYVLFRTYPICNFSGNLGPKLLEGDRQSPEGFYDVGPAQLNPASRFHLSFNLGFPNTYDRAHGRTGSALMVHGNCVSIGCYAMTDRYIEEIYVMADAALRNGQGQFKVHVFPFRMVPEKLAMHRTSTWYPFWLELKAGYDVFEQHGRPPQISVRAGKYVAQPEK